MKDPSKSRQLRVLFLCTQNSARSQIAEALLATRGAGRFVAASAGSQPAEHVNPGAVAVLREAGIEWGAGKPKSIAEVVGERWDLVITVCDRARDACPVFPETSLQVHWGTEDPAAVEDPEERKEAFARALAFLDRRIALLVGLSDEEFMMPALERAVRRIN